MNKILLLFCLLFLAGCGPVIQLNELTTLEYGASPWELVNAVDGQSTVFSWKNQENQPLSYTDLKIDTPYTFIVTSKKNLLVKKRSKIVTLTDTTAPKISVSTDKIQLEYGEKIDLNAWIAENVTVFDHYSSTQNIKIKIPNLDYKKKVQSQQVTFTDESGNTSVLTINIQIIDTTPPSITVFQEKFTITEGQPLPDFSTSAQAFDNKDHEVPITITPPLINRPGTYTHLYKACDQSGNCTEAPFILIVKPKPTPNPTPITPQDSSVIHPPKENPPISSPPESPVACTIKEDVLNGYNGGIYPSWDACKAAGEGKPYDCGTVYDSCGNLAGIGLILR